MKVPAVMIGKWPSLGHRHSDKGERPSHLYRTIDLETNIPITSKIDFFIGGVKIEDW